MRATSFFRTKKLISDDLPTFDRPNMANSGQSSLGQSLARLLLFTKSTSLTLASPASGPITIFDPGRTISSVTSSGLSPGGTKSTFCTNREESESSPRLEAFAAAWPEFGNRDIEPLNEREKENVGWSWEDGRLKSEEKSVLNHRGLSFSIWVGLSNSKEARHHFADNGLNGPF